MRNKFLLLFVLLSTTIFSYQWPTNKDFLLSFFGSEVSDNISDGIEFSSNNQAIFPLTDGDIIFYQDSFQFGDLEYKGNEGNVLVLNHIGDFKSIYRNFSSSTRFDSEIEVGKDEMIGLSDHEDSFIFSIYDNKKESYINPQQILPFLQDDRKPVINAVYLNSLDMEYRLYSNRAVPQGDSTIYIDAWDVVKVNNRYKKFIPFSINVFVDGLEQYSLTFSTLKEVDDKIYVSSEFDTSIEEVFSDKGYLLGGHLFLTKGRSLIEVVIKDIDGNEASKSYSVIVN